MTKIAPEKLYENVVLSLQGYAEAFRLEHMPTAEFVDWDDHANITELPEMDIIGLMGVGMAEDEANIYEIVCGFGISTYQDPGKARLTSLISKLRGRLVPKTAIRVLEPSVDGLTAIDKTWMVTALPLAVNPVMKAEVRAVQSIEVRLLLDPGASSPLR